MPIIKFLHLTITPIILKNLNYFLCYELKNRLRNFQPENGRKFKNKLGCSKIVVLIRKKVYKIIQYAKLEVVMSQRWEPGWDEDGKRTHEAIFYRCSQEGDHVPLVAIATLRGANKVRCNRGPVSGLGLMCHGRSGGRSRRNLDEIITVFPN